jgi:hypothetical protein
MKTEAKEPKSQQAGRGSTIRALMLLFAATIVGFGTGTLQAAPRGDECAHSECDIGEWCKMKAGYECTFSDPWTCSDDKCRAT